MNESNHDLYIKEKKKEFTELQAQAAKINRRAGYKVIKLCPVCVFTAVKIIPYTGGIYPEMYYCPKCNWQGIIPLEVDIKDLALLWERWLEAEENEYHAQEEQEQEQESDETLDTNTEKPLPHHENNQAE